MGAAREELPAESWTRNIQEWLAAARLIVLTVGRTEGVQWEVEQIRRLGLWPKVILLFPPVSDDELAIRWRSSVTSRLDTGEIRCTRRRWTGHWP